jgi:hypothetical protein
MLEKLHAMMHGALLWSRRVARSVPFNLRLMVRFVLSIDSKFDGLGWVCRLPTKQN